MPVTKISASEASALHSNYLNSQSDPAATQTKGVIFAFPELSEAIKAFEEEKFVSLIDEPEYGFICYFGRYAPTEPDGKANRNTLIVQFLKKSGTEWGAISGQIYNFGDLKPPKIILNEEVTSS